MTNNKFQPTHADLRHQIICAYEASMRAAMNAVQHAIEAGEGLLKAKAELRHGDFGRFCATLPIAPTTLRGYMRLARLGPDERQRVADLPLRRALRVSRADVETPADPVATVIIPLGSVGRAAWKGADGAICGLEIVPVQLAGEEFTRLHYAQWIFGTQDQEDVCVSRRPLQTTVAELLCEFLKVPVRPDQLLVVSEPPIFWGADRTIDEPAEVKQAFVERYRHQ